ncbi:MAG TPA: hypothetical protein O0X23_00980 [Methanocorpusculum sp.]|nr:hypothetical protein [Methanocorpusculum sp.]
MEKAFQKSKEHPVMYGLAAAEAADLAKEGVVTIIEIVDSTAYDVRFKLNDDDQCLNIYIYKWKINRISSSSGRECGTRVASG